MNKPCIDVVIRGNCSDPASTYKTVVLKPNWSGSRNILQQSSLSAGNTKYVIKWDFDLDGGSITVPEGCILEFDGGVLKNGTIIGQDTYINNVGGVECFGDGIVKEGTWRSYQDDIPKDGITKEEADQYYQPAGDYATRNELGGKADKSETYTKQEVDELVESAGGIPDGSVTKAKLAQEVADEIDSKLSQIKTVNGQSLVGEGNIEIEGGGEFNVQSDWNQTDNNKPDYIRNKPAIPQVPEIDSTPTAGSDNLVTSGGVYAAINDIADVENGSVTDTSAFELSNGYYWCTNKTFVLNTGDSVIVTPRHVQENQIAWAIDPIALEPVAGGFKYTSAADNARLTVGFVSADEFDYIITRKNSVLNSVSYAVSQKLTSSQQQIARLNIGAGSDSEWKQSVSNLAGNVYDKAHSYSKDAIDSRFNSLDIPEKVSDLPNDVNYLTEHQDISGKADADSVYTKEEVAAMLSNVPESDVIVVSELPVSGQANKLYRVAGEDSYSEYGWNGSDFVKLAEYNHGIDDEPAIDSNNLISSRGVAETYGAYEENEEFIKAEVDNNRVLINAVKKDGINYFPKGEINEAHINSFDNGYSVTRIEEIQEDWIELKLDKNNQIYYGLNNEGTHYFPKIKVDELTITDNKKPIQQVSFRGLTVFDRTTEWIGEDGYPYRMQGGCMDSNSGWIFIAGNRIVDGIQDQHNTMIIVTKNLTTFDGAKRFYGEYGHANDVAFNEKTNRLYVAAGSGETDTLGAKVVEFDFDSTEGELTFRRYIEFEDIAAKGGDVLNIEYIYDTDQYVVGSYSTGNIYDADFNLVKAGVFYYHEEVADRILGIPGTATVAQNLLYYDGYLYKIISLMQDATRLNFGLMLRFNMDGSLDGIHYITAPNTMGFELEDVIIDKKHKKIYTTWDGKWVAFMEGYLYNTVQIPPRALDYYEDLNHIQALGTYNIQNSGICATIDNFPSDLLSVKGDGTPEYHGCTVEVRPASTGGIVQFIYAFSGDYHTNQFESLIFTRQNREGNWNNWKKISLN